MTTTVEAAN